MTNLRQAAQQALEALERINAIHYLQDLYEALDWEIEALRAALAEPEQDPIGHADLGINNIYIFSSLEPRVVPAGRTPLYTAPTPRSWVGLTDEEVVDLKMIGRDLEFVSMTALRRFARDIEQTLKEKNSAPTPRKPLTDEEMRECAQAMNAEPLAEGWPELIKFARAIENKHGIGEQHGS